MKWLLNWMTWPERAQSLFAFGSNSASALVDQLQLSSCAEHEQGLPKGQLTRAWERSVRLHPHRIEGEYIYV
jgi:hypothetical protein